ncbi:MAG: translation elongation factor Ts [bacterium]|nr:translation elongation factor Ts [bacterium]
MDYTKLKQLRADTGISFSTCKKALEEADGDMKKAKEFLKKWGVETAQKKADRETKAGGVFTYMHHNRKVATLIELQSETDFVSGNDEFQSLGHELAMQAASVPADNVEEFMKQDYIRESGKTIEALVKEHIAKFGENIQIARFVRWELGG